MSRHVATASRLPIRSTASRLQSTGDGETRDGVLNDVAGVTSRDERPTPEGPGGTQDDVPDTPPNEPQPVPVKEPPAIPEKRGPYVVTGGREFALNCRLCIDSGRWLSFSRLADCIYECGGLRILSR